jgi:hypothetical protein
MSDRTSFYRKIGYAAAIVALCFVLGWLSAPATTTRAGGQLAQLRNEYKLAQVDLGDVDPASETIKLATLGLRGVAVNLLWNKANHYKKVEDWTSLTATLEQLAKLQPNFITFWKFQAWNLSYNVSVEFDDYKDRYYYVRRGIEFLQKGEQYNLDNPVLLWDLGWFIGQKIGRADEHEQYRRLFKNDDDYHPADRPLEERDNWLVGKEQYVEAISSVDDKGFSLGRKSPRDFYSSPAKSQMNYAEAIEKEGYFDKARRAWIKAADEWRQFGETVIEHSFGEKLLLGSESELQDEVDELLAKLEAMLPGVRETLAKEKRAALTDEDRQIVDTPREQLSPEQSSRIYEIQVKLEVSDRDIAERIGREHPEKKNEALRLANLLERRKLVLQYTRNYKRDANYDYWQLRCDFEQTANAIAARRLMFEANNAFKEADVVTAKKLYDEGFAKWRLVIDEFPAILDDEAATGEDLLDYVKQYRKVLDQLDERLGDDFPLWEVIENFDSEQEFTEELQERNERQGQAPNSAADTSDEESTTTDDASSPADNADQAAATPSETSSQTNEADEKSAPANGTSSQPDDAQPQGPTSEPAADGA